MILSSPLFFNTLSFTLKQALLSALAATFIGLLAAPGYARLGQFKNYLRWILLVPTLMSPVLVILALLVTLGNFPFGILGILLGHIFLNAGLATVWIGESWNSLEIKWAPVNHVLGGGPWFFFRKIMIPVIGPSVLSSFAVIFSFCAASFAIPLIFGGGPQNSTLEVLIYERLRVAGDYRSALILAVVQCGLQFIIFRIALRTTQQNEENNGPRFLIEKKFSKLSLLPLAVGLLSILPFINILRGSAVSLPKIKVLLSLPDYSNALFNSLAVALFVSALTFCFLGFYMALEKRAFLTRIPALSGVVVGLAALLVINRLNLYSHISFLCALVIGHFIVVAPPVLRLSSPKLNSAASFFGPVAYQLGASRFFALRRIFLRLGFKTIALACLLSFLWSFGEFSVSRVVSGEYLTLPLFVGNLISSYRLELASLASLILLGSSLLVLFLVEGFAYEFG